MLLRTKTLKKLKILYENISLKHFTVANPFIRSGIPLNELKQDSGLLKVWRNVISPHCNCPQPNCNQRERYRSPDGKCNNVKHPKWGSTFTPQHRYLPPAYHDGKFEIHVFGTFILNYILWTQTSGWKLKGINKY